MNQSISDILVMNFDLIHRVAQSIFFFVVGSESISSAPSINVNNTFLHPKKQQIISNSHPKTKEVLSQCFTFQMRAQRINSMFLMLTLIIVFHTFFFRCYLNDRILNGAQLTARKKFIVHTHKHIHLENTS